MSQWPKYLLKNEVESTFTEIVNLKKSNISVGVIYRPPSMDLTDFDCNYLNNLLGHSTPNCAKFLEFGYDPSQNLIRICQVVTIYDKW